MKIYIFADMEGASGICNSSFVEADGANYARGCKLMAEDVNACVRGCFKGGASEVVVRDGHSSGVNMAASDVDPRAKLIQGSAGKLRFPFLDGSAGIIFLCYHAMAGTKNAVLEHTFSSKTVQNMWLNGAKAGEFAIDSFIAAEQGVPTLMSSGDDKLCQEAAAWLPGVAVCQVKQGLSSGGALLLPLSVAREELERKTAEAVSKAAFAKLAKTSKPVSLRIEWVERASHNVPFDAEEPDARTVEISRDRLERALFELL